MTWHGLRSHFFVSVLRSSEVDGTNDLQSWARKGEQGGSRESIAVSVRDRPSSWRALSLSLSPRGSGLAPFA